jgi:hypothetical protein
MDLRFKKTSSGMDLHVWKRAAKDTWISGLKKLPRWWVYWLKISASGLDLEDKIPTSGMDLRFKKNVTGMDLEDKISASCMDLKYKIASSGMDLKF